MYSLKDEFLEIDRFLYNRLNLKFKKPYGVSIQLRTMGMDSAKVYTYADNALHVEEGEIAFFDDRYHVVWYHIISSITFEKKEMIYGRSTTSPIGIAGGKTIFWGKREALDVKGNRRRVFLMDFLKEVTTILLQHKKLLLKGWDLNQSELESQEFGSSQIHKESYIARLNFLLPTTLSLCDEWCEEIDCCPF